MQRRAFIFSLDAFVAFVLIAVVISMLIFVSSTPRASYLSLEQAHQLAYDTLSALSFSGDGSGTTYLGQILGGSGNTGEIMRRVAGGNPNYYGIIPKGFGYRLDSYNFNNDTWSVLYDAGSDASSDRYGKNYTKLRASSTSFISLYDVLPNPGFSPFCHLGCQGYNGLDNAGQPIYRSPCDTTPCNVTDSYFISGQNAVHLVRLMVYA